MASSSDNENVSVFARDFPSINNGKINAVDFVESATELVSVVDKLGSVFTPVKYDMQGNLEKIKKHYVYTKDSCLLELVTDELSKNKHTAAEGLFWLNRALSFFEIILEEILKILEEGRYETANAKVLFAVAYEGSVKMYHNWVTQQIFHVICKISPTSLPQLLKNLDIKDTEKFKIRLTAYNPALKAIRMEIDQYYKERKKFIK